MRKPTTGSIVQRFYQRQYIQGASAPPLFAVLGNRPSKKPFRCSDCNCLKPEREKLAREDSLVDNAETDFTNSCRRFLETDVVHFSGLGLLEDMTVKRILGYLDYAVENAKYLGPWSERPSERRTREARENPKATMKEEEEEESSLDEWSGEDSDEE